MNVENAESFVIMEKNGHRESRRSREERHKKKQLDRKIFMSTPNTHQDAPHVRCAKSDETSMMLKS
jgi:hypothetical protein